MSLVVMILIMLIVFVVIILIVMIIFVVMILIVMMIFRPQGILPPKQENKK